VIEKEKELVPLISIVDDDESVREATMGFLTNMGYRAKVFSSASELLGSPLLNETKCLILDLRMPGMNGLQLQGRLTADGRRIPIIFISAHDNQECQAEAMRGGAKAFLIKPFGEKAMLSAIVNALQISPENKGQPS
jgi:FixJ family two-component response regulator